MADDESEKQDETEAVVVEELPPARSPWRERARRAVERGRYKDAGIEDQTEGPVM